MLCYELNEAKVLAVGPGGLDKEGKRIPMSVGEGDKVLIPQVRIHQRLRSSRMLTVLVWRQPSESWGGGVLSFQGP